jgi:hypothetical protein
MEVSYPLPVLISECEAIIVHFPNIVETFFR